MYYVINEQDIVVVRFEKRCDAVRSADGLYEKSRRTPNVQQYHVFNTETEAVEYSTKPLIDSHNPILRSG